MNLTFKVDNQEIKVGQDMRVEYVISDDAHMTVVLTNEGLIIDWYYKSVCVRTMSQTYDEMSDDLKSTEEDWVE